MNQFCIVAQSGEFKDFRRVAQLGEFQQFSRAAQPGESSNNLAEQLSPEKVPTI